MISDQWNQSSVLPSSLDFPDGFNLSVSHAIESLMQEHGVVTVTHHVIEWVSWMQGGVFFSKMNHAVFRGKTDGIDVIDPKWFGSD